MESPYSVELVAVALPFFLYYWSLFRSQELHEQQWVPGAFALLPSGDILSLGTHSCVSAHCHAKQVRDLTMKGS